MNAKSKLLIKFAEGEIEMNTTFEREMRNPMSDEYALLQKARLDFPTFAVRKRQIKSNPKKDTYKGLTYGYMRMYIDKYEPEETVKEVQKYFEDQILISKCHGQRLRYPTIKKWFLAKYPEVARFGTFVDEAQNQDADPNAATSNSQNVIPMPQASTANEVEPLAS